jgi:hypothetical protein
MEAPFPDNRMTWCVYGVRRGNADRMLCELVGSRNTGQVAVIVRAIDVRVVNPATPS